MKSRLLILLAVVTLLAAAWQATAAQSGDPSAVRGAMLYDKWYAVLGTSAPAGDMPIWGRQTTDTQSGEDTWRCVSCHGWDYQGNAGAYRSGSHYTGFPGVYDSVQKMSVDEITAILKGQKDPEHDFSTYIDDSSINDLANFLKTSLIDDSEYIDLQTMAVIGGDSAKGQELYTSQCASCHGADGSTLKFRFEGQDATLGTIATIDPWRFLHKTRFGTPGTKMVIGADLGWTAEEGRDVLLYVQSLPSGLEPVEQGQARSNTDEIPQSPAGPSSNFFVGILTAFGAMMTSLGFAVILGGFLVGVIFMIVWALRERRK